MDVQPRGAQDATEEEKVWNQLGFMGFNRFMRFIGFDGTI
jgi:hypothetical protein